MGDTLEVAVYSSDVEDLRTEPQYKNCLEKNDL